METDRFDRQIRLFGAEGQRRLRDADVALVGLGGLGSIVAPQLALLGVGRLSLIDGDALDVTSRNRHFCARQSDPIPGTRKTTVVARAVREIDSSIEVEVIDGSVVSEAGFRTLKHSGFVLGAVDSEGVRLVLTEFCAAYAKPYIDMSSDVLQIDPIDYGGEVFCAIGGNGCLACMKLLDPAEAAEDLQSPEQRRDREKIYGVPASALDRSGPSVVSINGVIASLGVTEFMKLCTGLGEPTRHQKYSGRFSRVTVSKDQPLGSCYFCRGIWGQGADADVERFLAH